MTDAVETPGGQKSRDPGLPNPLPHNLADSIVARAVQANQLATFEMRSPLDRYAQRLLPVLRDARSVFKAAINRRDVTRCLDDLAPRSIDQKYVSFDFFDTLVVRLVEPPDFVLTKVAELSAFEINRRFGIGLTESAYLRGRSICEKALRRENRHYSGLDAETTLYAVLERFLSQLSICDESLLRQLLEEEIALESEVLALNEGARQLLEGLRREDKKILVLSDMYLTAGLLRDISGKLGIGDLIDEFYVSGETGLAKHSGRLYDHARRENGIAANELFHVGDNYHSDFKMPAGMGIQSRWLYDANRLRARRKVREELRTKPARFVDRIIQARSDELYPPGEVLERRLFSHFAPAVFTMAYRGIRAAVSLGIGRLYFLAREGICLREVFAALLERHPEFQAIELELRTLYCSRSSTVCARLPEPGDAPGLLSMVAERSGNFSLDALFAAWNIDRDSVQCPIESSNEPRSRQELLEFLSAQPDLCEELFRRVGQDRDHLLAYLEQEGVFGEPAAFVDVGWSGTIQRNIDALGKGARIIGLYLGTNEKFEARNLKGLIFSSSDYRAGAVHKSAGLSETLLTVGAVGTTVRYLPADQGVRPVFKEGEEGFPAMESVRGRVFGDFYPVFEQLTRQYCIPVTVLAAHARERYYGLVTRPDRAFLKAVSELKFNFDWGSEKMRPLVGRVSVRDMTRPARLLSSLWYSPWLFGTLKASYLGIFNRPLGWVLGHEELINREKLKKRAGFLRKTG